MRRALRHGDDVLFAARYAGMMASTRTGLPLPCTIFSGAAMTTAPVGGSWSRLHRLASPSLPAPCIVAWLEALHQYLRPRMMPMARGAAPVQAAARHR